MEASNQTHPSQTQLAALALGKLNEEYTARLKEHVAGCPTCAEFLSDTPHDSLVQLMRESTDTTRGVDQSTPGVHNRSTISGPPRSEQRAGVSRYPDPPRQTEAPIPQELRDQSKYRIMRLLGRGGMGAVYEAYHERMDRRVAIKIISPSLVDHPEALARFDQEVKAAAKLDHVNVARAYDADELGKLRVLVMEFVPGQSFDKFLAGRTRLTVIEACRLVRQALVGLEHAYQRGMVHRDLKPQNLMLTPDGKVKILDFGLAKLASEQKQGQGLTRTNALMGTPHYLAPEQALDAAKADIRADIYSLGCTLYCLLTGRPPFDGDSEMKVLLAHQHETARPLSEVVPEVPKELSDLADSMLAKNPSQRPKTPKEAAQAMYPFAKGDSQAGSSYPSVGEAPEDGSASLAAQLWRWCQNNRLAAGLGTLAVILLLTTLVASYAALRPRRKFSESDGGAAVVASKARPVDADSAADMRDMQAKLTLVRHYDKKGANGVAFSPDGQRVLAGGNSPDSTVAIWDRYTGERLQDLDVPGFTPRVSFAPEGKQAGISSGGAVLLWDLVDRTFRILQHPSFALGVAFSPGGRRVVSGGTDTFVRIWNADNGEEFCKLEGHQDAVTGVAYSSDGPYIVSASADKTARIWNAESGELVHELQHPDWVWDVAMSPDGSQVLTSTGGPLATPYSSFNYVHGTDNRLRLWELGTGKLIREMAGHEHVVRGVAFTPDGQHAVSASMDMSLRVWDLQTGREVARHDAKSWLGAVAVSPDGQYVLVSGGGRKEDGKWLPAVVEEHVQLFKLEIAPRVTED